MMVLVIPSSPDMCKHLRHPDNGIRAFSDLTTPVEWPFDAFTMRRLADGDIKQIGTAPIKPKPVSNKPRYPVKRGYPL